MSLSDFLQKKGITDLEGFCQQIPQQVDFLAMLTKKPYSKILEIGFNAGHSAEIFLKQNPTSEVVSFDLGAHTYVKDAKEYIDSAFPRRHYLILGDSRVTIPTFTQHNLNLKFDVLFIDGGHDYEIAMEDLVNCNHLAHKDTIVIMDDTTQNKEWMASWSEGPTRAWRDYINQGKLFQLGTVDFLPGRGMSWGKYIL